MSSVVMATVTAVTTAVATRGPAFFSLLRKLSSLDARALRVAISQRCRYVPHVAAAHNKAAAVAVRVERQVVMALRVGEEGPESGAQWYAAAEAARIVRRHDVSRRGGRRREFGGGGRALNVL